MFRAYFYILNNKKYFFLKKKTYHGVTLAYQNLKSHCYEKFLKIHDVHNLMYLLYLWSYIS